MMKARNLLLLLVLLFVLLAAVPASSANVTHGVSLADTTNKSVYTTGSFTPALNDLLVVFVHGRETLDRPAVVTDSQSGTYTQILALDSGSAINTMYLFIRDSLAPNTSMAVTFDCTGDAASAVIVLVLRVSGMTNTGSSASLQTANQTLQSGGTTPAPAFSSSALTGNPTLGFVANHSSPAALTPPTNWTERADVGVGGPGTGGEDVSRDSGFTGTTITWGSTSGSVFGDIIVELDSSGAAARRPVTVY